MCTTSGDAGFFNNSFATGAGRTLFAENLQKVGEISFITISVNKVLECSTTDFDGLVHDLAGGGGYYHRLFFGQGVAYSCW